MSAPAIASRAEWRERRLALLAEEKALTHAREALAAKRRALPWVRVDADYAFDGPQGRVGFDALFAGKSQLIVYHFMFAPDWEQGCKSCSFWADGFDRALVHLAQRDVALAAVSRAPLAKLAAFASRLGWSFPWYSCGDDAFAYDFGVSFRPDAEAAEYNYAPKGNSMADLPGISVFARDAAGAIHHTYSCFARGLDPMNPAYQYLDLVPKGRDEDALPFSMAWVRIRDLYPSQG
jgi:predicted dithiol-disulfide oxidoreductase (DUF899 family)